MLESLPGSVCHYSEIADWLAQNHFARPEERKASAKITDERKVKGQLSKHSRHLFAHGCAYLPLLFSARLSLF
jgi:hypothetical protein